MAQESELTIASLGTTAVGATETAMQNIDIGYKKCRIYDITVVASATNTGNTVKVKVFGKDTKGTAYNTVGYEFDKTITIADIDGTRFGGFVEIPAGFIHADLDSGSTELHYTLTGTATSVNVFTSFGIVTDLEGA